MRAVATKSLVLASASLVAFLSLWESGGKTILTVYPDKLAGGLPTVCDGITKYSYTEKAIVVGESWTKEDCHDAESFVIDYTQQKLSKCMPYATQSALDAITSLSHNMGVDRVCKESRAVRLINAGKIAEGCRAIAWGEKGQKVWASADKIYYPGLHRRRLDEMKMCLSGL
jgi:lysozyme